MATTSINKSASDHRRHGWFEIVADAVTTALTRRRSERPVIPAITVNRRCADVFAYLRDLDNVPDFVEQVSSVAPGTDQRWRWLVSTPTGQQVHWQVVVTGSSPERYLTWEIELPDERHVRGAVTFAPTPGGDGTEVRVELAHDDAERHHRIADAIAAPAIRAALRHLKQVLETGEVLVSDASIHAGPHPAQPSTPDDAGTDVGGAS